MNRILYFILGVSLLVSCQKEEKPNNVVCKNAQLNLCNPTTDQIVVYGWGTNQAFDTLFPGECKIKDFGELKILYNDDGSIKHKESSIGFYYTDHGSRAIEMFECYVIMDAPTGYINIAHCYNGVFNPEEGELDTDCGGNCLPCKNFNIPCDTMQLNRFKWSDNNSLLRLSHTYTGNYYDSNKTIEFTFYDGEIFYLSVPGSDLPTKDERLVVGNEFHFAKAWFTDYYGNKRRKATENSSIYFLIDSVGQKSVKFCDVDFEYANGNTVQASANLSVD